jgi:hypothetical protein
LSACGQYLLFEVESRHHDDVQKANYKAQFWRRQCEETLLVTAQTVLLKYVFKVWRELSM